MKAVVRTPFFLGQGCEKRFCLHSAPKIDFEHIEGCIVYLHPFAEEMNRSRREVFSTVEQLVHQKWAVFQIDHFGCGDSAGEFDDVLLEHWLVDVDTAIAWVHENYPDKPVVLWGIRFSCLLLSNWEGRNQSHHPLIMWQPIVDGTSFKREMLRLHRAGLLNEGIESQLSSEEQLNQRGRIRVAGYEMSLELFESLESFKLLDVDATTKCCVIDAGTVRPIFQKADVIQAKNLVYRTVQSPKFWLFEEVVDATPFVTHSIAYLSSLRW